MITTKALLISTCAALCAVGAAISANTSTVTAAPDGEAACGIQTPPQEFIPADDKVLRLVGQAWEGLDPHTEDYTSEYVYELYSGLVSVAPDMSLMPDLAERWTVSEDGRIYTFHLHPDATFHDGRQVTANDVQYSFERAVRQEAYGSDIFLADVTDITVLDDATIQITLQQAAADFLPKLSYRSTFIVDRYNVEGGEDWESAPNGTGPFKFTYHEADEILWLSRFDEYHREPAKVAALHFNLRGCDGYVLYRNGVIDLYKVPWWIVDDIPVGHPLTGQLQRGPSQLHLSSLSFDTTKAPFDDRNVRLALNYAIDRANLPTVTAPRVGDLPAYGILPPSMPGYDPGLEGYRYDMDKARLLLAKSKYAGDLPPITFYWYRAPGAVEFAILDAWRELGLTVQVEVVAGGWTDYSAARKEQNYAVAGINWLADYPEASTFLGDLYHTDSSFNRDYFLGYSNPMLDLIMDYARAEKDETTRLEFYRLAERVILADAPSVPISHNEDLFYLVKPNVSGVPLAAMRVAPYRHVSVGD